MNRFLLCTVLIGFLFNSGAEAQTQVAAWTFDVLAAVPNTPSTNAANLGTQSATATIFADGTNGSSTWITATTGNELTSFAGSTTNDPRTSTSAGSAMALVGGTGNSANNKSIVIKFSMTNFKDPILSFATRGTSTGFNTHAWSWSTDGSSFTSFGSNTANTGSTFTTKTLDLSSIDALDGAATVYLKLTVSGATSSSGNNRLDNIVVNATDTSPPYFTASYPQIQNGATSFNVVVNLDKTATVYVGVYTEGGATPAQTKAGLDKYDNPLPSNLKPVINVTSAGTDFTATITGVSPSTAYYVYYYAENAYGYYIASNGFLTLSSSDATPPSFVSSYPKIDPVNPTGFTLKTELDEVGKTYFVILNSGASAPTADQVKNGQDASGAAVANGFSGTINVTSASSEFTSQVSGLSLETSYDVYVVAEDNIPNLQTSPVKISIATGAQFSEDFTGCDSNSFTTYSVTGAQAWSCVGFGYNGTNGFRMNGFSGSAVANEDWLISPVVNLNAAASVSFYSQFSFAGNGLKLKISSDYSGSGDPNAATWTDLNGGFPSVAVGSTSTSVLDWTLSNVDLSAYSGKVHIAFVYTSTASAAARWTVDNFVVNNAKASYLQVSPLALSFSANNSTKNYTLKGYNLTNDVVVTSFSNFSVSKDNATFGSTINYTAAEAMAQPTIYVKFNVNGVTTDTYTASILNSSSGVDSKPVTVTGTDKSQTLNIATYNLEFFGTDVKDASNVEFGPTDDALQVANVTTVLQTIGADIYGVEEIADDNALNQLVSNLSGYDKVISSRWSYSWQAADPNFPPQKIGFIYNTSKMQLVSSRVMFAEMYDAILAGTKTLPNYPTGTSSSFWSSGRLPFMATFDVTVNGVTRRIRMIDIHGKSASDTESYNRRVYDAGVLRDTLNAYYPHDNIILLGDFNDQVYGSIKSGSVSSYKTFVDDVANFKAITYDLNVSGATTFPSSTSFIDNIIVSNELVNALVNNSVAVEDPRNYISSYTSTTSDHLPVTARFLLSSKADQAITFTTLPSKTLGDADFTLQATASSGLPVSFVSSDPTTVSLNGNVATILKAGSVTITANQTGNSDFNAATNVERSLMIKSNQSITFTALPSKTFGDASFTLQATASSGLSVSFTSSDPTTVSLNGNVATILKVGSVTITASQAGNDDFNAATNIDQYFTINKGNQTITFAALPSKTYGDANFTLQAIASSGLLVSFASSDPTKVSLSGNVATILKPGSVTITANQAGSDDFSAATNVDQPLVINKANQTIAFTALPSKTYGDANFTLQATASSGLPVSFVSSDPTKVSLNGNVATILKAGSVTITASQAGSDDFNVATNVDQSLAINKANQTIAFTALPSKTYGDANFTLAATTSSGLPVSFTSSDPTKVSLNGDVATILKAGSVTITASQSGNDNFNAASNVDRSLAINKANQTITFTAIADKTIGSPSFPLTGTSTSGLAVTFATASDKVTIATNQVTIAKAGRLAITASQTGNENYNAATSVDRSFCINPAKPVITITNAITATPTLTSNISTGNQWYFNGGVISNATNSSLVVNTQGNYKVQTHSDDCFSEFSNEVAVLITGLEKSEINISAYPNPTSDYLFVSGVDENTKFSIFDLAGRLIHVPLERLGEETKLSLNEVPQGIYILRVNKSEAIRVLKIVKK